MKEQEIIEKARKGFDEDFAKKNYIDKKILEGYKIDVRNGQTYIIEQVINLIYTSG